MSIGDDNIELASFPLDVLGGGLLVPRAELYSRNVGVFDGDLEKLTCFVRKH